MPNPERVDLREVLWPVEDVGNVAASAASAAATALEYHCNRIGEPPTRLSTAFIHYNARLIAGQEGANTGTTLESALKAIETYGACRQESWPLDTATLAVKPPAQAYGEARKFAKTRALNPADFMEALALRYPVPFTARVTRRCLEEAGRTGLMPAPSDDELQSHDAVVNHAMVLVGYDRSAQVVTARNCWGAQWGHQGHCTIAFDVMNAIAPYGMGRLWIIATPEPASTIGAGTPIAPPSQSSRLSEMAAKMREEIRAGLQKDLEDASKRIREMVRKPEPPDRDLT